LFLIERAALTAAGATNNNIAVTGFDEKAKACVATYFHSDGTRGSYRLAVDGDRMTINWDRYRFAGSFSADRTRLMGTWELARTEQRGPTGTTWRWSAVDRGRLPLAREGGARSYNPTKLIENEIHAGRWQDMGERDRS